MRLDAIQHRATRIELEHQVWMALCRKEQLHEIAVTFGITEQEIGRIERRFNKRYDVVNEAAKKNQKAAATAFYSYVRDESVRKWEQSKDNPTRQVTSGRTQYDARASEVIPLPDLIVTTERLGDPVWLNQAVSAQKRIDDLWGLDAAQKVEVSNVDPSADAAATQSQLAKILVGIGPEGSVEETAAALGDGQPETALHLGFLGTPEPVRTEG